MDPAAALSRAQLPLLPWYLNLLVETFGDIPIDNYNLATFVIYLFSAKEILHSTKGCQGHRTRRAYRLQDIQEKLNTRLNQPRPGVGISARSSEDPCSDVVYR